MRRLGEVKAHVLAPVAIIGGSRGQLVIVGLFGRHEATKEGTL